MPPKKISLVQHQFAFLLDVAKLIEHAKDRGFMVTGGELYRTQDQQEIYYKAGKSKTLDSNHTRRLAIDLHFFLGGNLCDAKEIEPVGMFWEGLSPLNRWGGRFKGLVDAVHFERNVTA